MNTYRITYIEHNIFKSIETNQDNLMEEVDRVLRYINCVLLSVNIISSDKGHRRLVGGSK